MLINRIVDNTGLRDFYQWLLMDDVKYSSLFHCFLHRSGRILYAVVHDLKNGQLSLRAMSLVYTTIIAIVPLLALSFSILKGFGMHESLKPVLLDIMQDLGDKRFDIVDKVMAFINNVNVGVLGSVGFVVLIYSVIAMIHKIENAFNYTWQIARARSISHRIRDYLSVVFIAPLLLIVSAVLTGSSRFESVITLIESMPFGGLLMSLAGFVLPYLLMCLGFAFIYLFIPNTRVKVSSALLGGLVTTIIWKLMGWGVANFVVNSTNNIAIYSAFASVIVLMVWLYFSWFALLIGASVSFYYQNFKAQSIGRADIKLSIADKEALALEVMKVVGTCYVNMADSQCSHGHASVSDIAVELGVSEVIVDQAVALLLENGFLLRYGEDQEKLVPQRPLNQIMLNDLLAAARHRIPSKYVIAHLSVSTSVRKFCDKMTKQQNQLLDQVSLEDLMTKNERDSH